jgi:dUTP pyrophosphatase
MSNSRLEVRFKKVHEEAVLPARNHPNRPLTDDEKERLDEENRKFSIANPQAYEHGYRIGFPFENDETGNPTDKVLGTGDSGYDIHCVEDKTIPANGSAVVETGIDLAYISPGFWFKIQPRSGLGFKHGIQPHLGTIDNPYRGNLGVKLYNLSNEDYQVTKGDRIAQMVFYPVIEPVIEWSEEKHETERSEDGFGSSGK